MRYNKNVDGEVLTTTGHRCVMAKRGRAAAQRTDSDSTELLDIEKFIAQSSSDLFARLSESDNDSPSPDVIKRLTALPKEQARIAATKVAAALEEKLDSLWKATEEQQFLELSALSSGVKLEEAAEEKKRQARTQLNVEGPRACALLATLWAAAEEARSSAGDGSSHDGSEQSSRVSTVWRCHAALWACSQAVAKELDTHVADTIHPSADALPSCSQSPSPRGQSASPRGFSSTTPPPGANGNADTEVKVDEVNVDAELKVVDDPSSVSPLARPGSKLSSPFPTSSSSSIPQWETVMGFLAGGGRLSTMSEPRLKELHEPCKQWLLLMLYWLDLTRLLQAKLASTAAADDASSGRWRIELLARPPPLVSPLLPRVIATLLSAHVRLGETNADGIGGGALVGMWSVEGLKEAFSAYKARASGEPAAKDTAKGGQFGNEIAWGVASVGEAFGLSGRGGLYNGLSANGEAAQALPAEKAFRRLLEWASR